MISADTKTNVKQGIKELEPPSNLILSVKSRGFGWEGFYLTTKICYAWKKLFGGDHLVVVCFHLNSKITSHGCKSFLPWYTDQPSPSSQASCFPGNQLLRLCDSIS